MKDFENKAMYNLNFRVVCNDDYKNLNYVFELMDSIVIAYCESEKERIIKFLKWPCRTKTNIRYFKGHFITHGFTGEIIIMVNGKLIEIETIGPQIVYYAETRNVLIEKKIKQTSLLNEAYTILYG